MGAGYNIRAKANAAAEIYIYEDVGEGWFGGVSAKQFAEDLKALGKVETIDLRINSYGGSVFDGLAIYRQLVEHPAKVTSHVDGIAASIASVIAMAGDEILIAEAGFMMIHNASGVVIGQADDMRQMAELLDTISATIADVYNARTQQSVTQLKTWMDGETWMTAAECIDRGFATALAENMRVAAHYDLSRHKFQHAPETLAAAAGKSIGAAIPELPPGAAELAKPRLVAGPVDPLVARIQLQRARLTASAAA